MDRQKLKKICVAAQALCEVIKIAIILKKEKEKLKVHKKRKRSCAVRYLNRNRVVDGFYNVTFIPMKNHDHAQFFNYTRMNINLFNSLLTLLKPQIENSSRKKSAFISAECRLSVLLMYLAQGVSMQNIASSFKMGKETIRCIIYDTTNILWKTLHSFYVAEPNLNDYEEIENDFKTMWNFPNCIGAVDGKHIAMECPPRCGDEYADYKNFQSIVLMATCDAKYRFKLVDVGTYGSQHQSGIFQNSKFGKAIISATGPIPPPKPLPGSEVLMNHYFVGDAAFPLGLHLMRPYAGQNLSSEHANFNKRLTRARRVIENAFGILVARWRILQTKLHMYPRNAEKIVLSCVLLHNFIMLNDDGTSTYFSKNYVDTEDNNGLLQEGLWRSEIQNTLPQVRPSYNQHNYGGHGSRVMRNRLCSYILNH